MNGAPRPTTHITWWTLLIIIMYWQRDYQREVMNIFNHTWSDITDLDDLLYIQVPSYNYNARESVSVDMHFTVKLIKLFFFFFSLKVTFVELFFRLHKGRIWLQIIALCFLFTFTQHHFYENTLSISILLYSISREILLLRQFNSRMFCCRSP